MPLPLISIYADMRHVVTAGEAAGGVYQSDILRGPCFLFSIAVVSNNALCEWEAIIHKEIESYTTGITLFQRERQRGVDYDVIWEGRRYIPRGWVLTVRNNFLAAGDVLSIHGGYEEVVH